MGGLRWTFLILALICLVPVVSIGLANLAAWRAGCGSLEAEFLECKVRGVDVAPMLTSLAGLSWLSLSGAASAVVLGLVWVLSELVAMFIGKRPGKLKF